MPLLPEFNCYEELGVDKDASTQDIKDAYRRLALSHHPDKNIDNPEATSRFQRISHAYEILSDSAERARHDRKFYPPVGPSRPPGGFGDFFYEDEHDDDEYFHEAGTDDFIRQFFAHFSRFHRGGPRDEEEKRRASAEMAARMKAGREKWEKEEVEKAWKETKADTPEERQKHCLHLGFFSKEKQKKKLDCKPCGQKRGMVGFKCSHCGMLFCQACLAEFRKK